MKAWYLLDGGSTVAANCKVASGGPALLKPTMLPEALIPVPRLFGKPGSAPRSVTDPLLNSTAWEVAVGSIKVRRFKLNAMPAAAPESLIDVAHSLHESGEKR